MNSTYDEAKKAFLEYLERDSPGDHGIGILPDLHDLISELLRTPEAAAKCTMYHPTAGSIDEEYHTLLNNVISAAISRNCRR